MPGYVKIVHFFALFLNNLVQQDHSKMTTDLLANCMQTTMSQLQTLLAEHAQKQSFYLNTIITDGHNLTVVVTGPQLDNALNARERLGNIGWDTEILYIHTIRPLDEELVRASVRKTKRVLVEEEHIRSGGLGDDVMRATMDIPYVSRASLSIPDTFITEYGTYKEHCQNLGLTSDGILEAVRSEFGVPDGQ